MGIDAASLMVCLGEMHVLVVGILCTHFQGSPKTQIIGGSKFLK